MLPTGAEDSTEKFRVQPEPQRQAGAYHCRHFHVAGIHVRVESDFDLNSVPFKDELTAFAAGAQGGDNVTLRHCFYMPDFSAEELGAVLYRKAPWIISRKNGNWFYRGVSSDGDDPELHRIAVFNSHHTHATVYSPPGYANHLKTVGWHSLSLLPTDQIWLAPVLADRGAVLLHSGAAILNGRGLMFVGHSSAGKSTTMTMLKDRAEILCDDRNVARRWTSGWRLHGTWSHGDVADVSSTSAPLHAILFLQQDTHNDIVPITDRKMRWRLLLATLIKPMVTAEWWRKELDVIERIVNEVPCYMMRFDKSGAIVGKLEELTRGSGPVHGLSETRAGP
ncbi:MAG: hypothetical protein WA418_08085 [Bradyrhizobium sp.]